MGLEREDFGVVDVVEDGGAVLSLDAARYPGLRFCALFADVVVGGVAAEAGGDNGCGIGGCCGRGEKDRQTVYDEVCLG